MEAHRFSEPFCEYWKDPSKLSEFNWKQSEFYFTSISVPIGIKEKKWAPNILEFKQAAEECGINVQIAVIGRDQNILYNQQTRLRGEHTLPEFMQQLDAIPDATYLSYELLYLYKEKYLQSLHLNIPICYYSNRVNEILENDANEKYVHYVDENPLDNCNRTGVKLKHLPLILTLNGTSLTSNLDRCSSTKDSDEILHAADEPNHDICCSNDPLYLESPIAN